MVLSRLHDNRISSLLNPLLLMVMFKTDTIIRFLASSSMKNKFIYVDDMLITGSDAHMISDLKLTLQSHFKLKDLGAMKYLSTWK